MKIELKHRWNGSILFECEALSIKAALTLAVEKKVDLQGANLRYANLRGANLRGAKLEEIKADVFSILAVAKQEVAGLYDALVRGKVDGSVYQGECACLVGTIAKIRKEDYNKLGIDLRPDSSRPAEKWFLGICKGDTPESSPIVKLTAEWVQEFAKQEGTELPAAFKRRSKS
jgi:hypothetical protein